MSVAAFRIRKAVKALSDEWKITLALYTPDGMYTTKVDSNPYLAVIDIIDQELELEAERTFTQSINPQIG